jgi:hypothetical protein
MVKGPLAGVSGPGKFSKRTDMELGSQFYGDDISQINTAAIKSKTRGVADDVGGRPANPVMQEPVTPLFAPSQRRDEPITTGVLPGDGAGPEVLMMQSKFAERKLSDILADMIPYDQSGEVAILYQQVTARGQ